MQGASMFIGDNDDDVIVFEKVPGPDDGETPEKADSAYPYGYIKLSLYLSYVQGGALALGSGVSTYMVSIELNERRGANLGDDQLIPYVYLTWVGIAVLAIEMAIWLRRVKVARIELSKHKDDSFVPHGAEPLPTDVVTYSHESRISKLVSFGIVSVLAGASLPYASMMLASQTSSGETLGAARLMFVCTAVALLAAVARHLSPFITKGVTVYRDDSGNQCLSLMAIVALIAVLDAATFGAAATAAVRPLSRISVTPRPRRSLSWFSQSPPPPPPPGFPPVPVASPPPEVYAPPPKPQSIATWIGDGVRGSVLSRAPTDPLGDAERDAMCVIAAIAAVAAVLWMRVMYFNITADTEKRRRVFIYVVIASALQGVLVGTVVPEMTVMSSTADFAQNVADSSPNASVTWQQDPMSYVISVLVALAAVCNTCAYFASDIYSAM